MKVFFVIIICSLSIYNSAFGRSEMKLDPSLLSAFVKSFVNSALKRSEMQEYIWTDLTFDEVPIKTSTTLNEMARFYRQVLDLNDFILSLSAAVNRAYVTKISRSRSCCNVATGSYSKRFKLRVDFDKVCVLLSESSKANPFYLTDPFLTEAKRISGANPQVKWIHFSSNEGVISLYPASTGACDVEDSRFRPWYLQTIYRRPKLVMIVIDKSTSMRDIVNGISLMDLAKEAAKAIIDLLNPYDKFGVVAFANRPETRRSPYGDGGCFTTDLSIATPKNKLTLSKFVDSLTPRGGSYYVNPINMAFDFFIRELTKNSSERALDQDQYDLVIHFLSDGASDDFPQNILYAIRSSVKLLNHKITFMAYGVGGNVTRLLSSMVKASDDGKLVGKSNSIITRRHIRNQMAGFYHEFATVNEDGITPVWSFPYIDSTGIGPVMTISLPVRNDAEFIGVVGMDIHLHSLFALSSFYKPSELSYAYVITHKGLVLNHPFFYFRKDQDYLNVYVDDVEGYRSDTVSSELLAGPYSTLGFATYEHTKPIPQGSSQKYGVLKRKLTSSYAWLPVPSTQFTVGISIAEPYKESIMVKGGETLEKGSVLYHRFDVVPPKKQCVHVNSLSSPDKSSVFLAARAFTDPYAIDNDLKPGHVRDIANFIETKGPTTSQIKESARKEVVATHRAEDLWLKRGQDSQLKNQVIWRFVGTKHGAYRVYPGTQLPFDFDPVRRSWYQQAVANRNKSVITTPYKDVASGAAVISLSHALFETRPENDEELQNAAVFAVMGVDFLLTYFYDIFLKMYPVCQEKDEFKCLVIDNGGYVILTDEYAVGSFESEVHLAEIEPQVTSVLVRNGVLRRTECSNVATGLLQRTYSISDSQGVFWGTYGRGFWDFFGFKLLPVPGTNAFLIIRSVSDSKCVNVFKCHCQENVYSERKLCKSTWKDRFCECPCPSDNPYYDACSNKYQIFPEPPLPCTPESPSVTPLDIEYDLSFLPNCYNISFQRFIETETDYTYYIAGSAVGVLVLLISFCFIWSHPRVEEMRRKHRLKVQEVAMESLKKELVKSHGKHKGHHHFVYSHKMTRLFSKLKKTNPHGKI